MLCWLKSQHILVKALSLLYICCLVLCYLFVQLRKAFLCCSFLCPVTRNTLLYPFPIFLMTGDSSFQVWMYVIVCSWNSCQQKLTWLVSVYCPLLVSCALFLSGAGLFPVTQSTHCHIYFQYFSREITVPSRYECMWLSSAENLQQKLFQFYSILSPSCFLWAPSVWCWLISGHTKYSLPYLFPVFLMRDKQFIPSMNVCICFKVENIQQKLT